MNQGYNRDDVWNLRRASETALAEDLGPQLFELGGVYDPGVAQLGKLLETGDRVLVRSACHHAYLTAGSLGRSG